MQRSFRLLAAFLLAFLISLPLMAEEAEIEAQGTPLRKLQRGFLNIALCPIEISNELAKEVRNDTLPPSWFAGIGRGSFYAVGRALVGAYEIVTFPLAYPNCYQPILKPEFEWEHLSDQKG